METLLSYHAPSFSVTKEPNFGFGSSRKQGLLDMNDVMDWVAAFIAQNEWVSRTQSLRFKSIYERHKEQYEKAKGKNILSDYCNPKGHLDSQLLWKDLKQLKDGLADAVSTRLTDVLDQRQKRRAEQKNRRLASMQSTMSTHSEGPDDDEVREGSSHSLDALSPQPAQVEAESSDLDSSNPSKDNPTMTEVKHLGSVDGPGLSASPTVWVFCPDGPESNRPPEPGDTVWMSDEELAAAIDRRSRTSVLSMN
ncbi:hypothetical protein FRB95_013196 [Tulasnella sp. JGI-2019a]|nr:hypothetical protein FRB95_013196 [Tulasnella sp. JGI-2019a]